VILNPKVIIEVLSPSTEERDRVDKFERYQQIKSLTDDILIAQDRASVEHFVVTMRQTPMTVLMGNRAGG